MVNLSHFHNLRLALLADTHGHVDPRVAAEVRGCDVVVHAGDIGGASVFNELAPQLGIVIAVRGNNDRPGEWPEGKHPRSADLEQVATLELPGGPLVVVHGDRHNPASRRHDLLRQEFAVARAIVYGHSHRLACDCDVLPWVLNPGAAGRVRTYGGPSCLILSVTETRWRIDVRRFELKR